MVVFAINIWKPFTSFAYKLGRRMERMLLILFCWPELAGTFETWCKKMHDVLPIKSQYVGDRGRFTTYNIYIFFDVHFKFHILEMSRLGIQMLLANNSDWTRQCTISKFQLKYDSLFNSLFNKSPFCIMFVCEWLSSVIQTSPFATPSPTLVLLSYRLYFPW